MGTGRRLFVWTMTLVGALLGAGCNDECSGPACEAARTPDSGVDGGGTDASLDAPAGDAGPCTPWVDPNECMATDTCPYFATVGLGLENVASVATAVMANPEIVDMVPGTHDLAIVASSIANQIVLVRYTRETIAIARNAPFATGSATSVLTSIKVSPDGSYAAVTVAEADCALGRVLFADISDTDAFGTVLGSVTVGYEPDSGDFSADGHYFVTADEDDRAERSCKPPDRWGGSVSVVDVSGGPTGATLAQRIMVDHALDSEPEGIAIGPDGTAIVAIQETSEIVFLDLDDVPAATLQVEPAMALSGPDGVAFSDTAQWAAVGYEETDGIAIIDPITRRIVSTHTIARTGEVPDSYNRDDRRTLRVHEPEQLAFVRSQGALFLINTLQESHAAIAFRLDETTGELTFDSIAPVGINYASEAGMRASSNIGPEGVAVDPLTGLVITANEREGSISLLRTARSMERVCP